MTIPCGNCVGCRLDKSMQWTIRASHEAQLYNFNTAITLTYADENLPANNSLDHRDYQLFMKKLRRHLSYRKLPKVRFLMCGEYGPQTARPHYHALIFNFHLPDRKEWKEINGYMHYTSETLEKLWPFGFSSCTDVTPQSAGYVARYNMKKVTGKAGQALYQQTGRVPPYLRSSTGGRQPDGTTTRGIGYEWFKKYYSDVFPDDFVVIDGKKRKVPTYYDKLLKETDAGLLDRIKSERISRARNDPDHGDVERLAVKKKVLIGRTSTLQRKDL